MESIIQSSITSSIQPPINGDGFFGLYSFLKENANLVISYEGNDPKETGRYPEVGRCLSVSNGQYVDCGAALVPEHNDFEIICWFNSSNASADQQILVSQYELGYDGRMNLSVHQNQLAIFIADSPTNLSIKGGVVLDNTWHKAKLEHINGSINLYLDGILVGSQSFSGQVYQGVNTRIGQNNSGTYFNGKIGYTKIHNTYYGLNHRSGAICLDENNNANSGLLINGGNWTTDKTLPLEADRINLYGGNKHRYGNGGYVEFDATHSFSGDFKIVFEFVITGQNWDRYLFGSSANDTIYLDDSKRMKLLRNGANLNNTQLAKNTLYTVTLERVGTQLTTTINGVSKTITSSVIFDLPYVFGRASSSSGRWFGTFVSLEIDNGNTGELDHKYKTVNGDWTDLIGINNGTEYGNIYELFVPPKIFNNKEDVFETSISDVFQGLVYPIVPRKKDSYCLKFTGDTAYAYCGNIDFSEANSLDIELTFSSDGSDVGRIFAIEYMGNDDIRVGFTINNELYCQLDDGTVYGFILSSGKYIDGKQHTLVARFDGVNFSLYIDGNFEGNTNASSFNLQGAGGDVFINNNQNLNLQSSCCVSALKILVDDVTVRDYVIASGVGHIIYDRSLNYSGILINADTSIEGLGVWAGRDQESHFNYNNGFTLYSDGVNKLRVPYVNRKPYPNPSVPSGYYFVSENPALYRKHNGAETTEDAYNVSEDESPVPATNNLVNFAEISFNDTKNNLMLAEPIDCAYRKDVSSVNKSRLMVFADSLATNLKQKALKYT